jgi:signal transduction histidine kinase/DNA-binding response OmpR family regulator/ligand-binding sensor domain-containing protein
VGQRPDLGIPHITIFSAKSYGAELGNFRVGSDRQGLIYCANNSGLLEYDGIRWKLHKFSQNSNHIRSFFCADNGNIYIGSLNEIGYFKSEAGGNKIYHSLTDSLPNIIDDFGPVFDVLEFKGMAVFRSKNMVAIFDGDKLKAFTTVPDGVLGMFVIKEVLFIKTVYNLITYENGEDFVSKTATTFDLLNEKSGLWSANMGEDSLLIGSLDHGLFFYHKGVLKPFRTPIDSWLIPSRPISAQWIKKQKLLAIASLHNGIAFFDERYKLVGILNKTDQLKIGVVTGLFTDRYNNLWTCGTEGIAHIEINAPFRYMGTPYEFTEAARLVAVQDNTIIAGGGGSLLSRSYRLPNVIVKPKFSAIPGTSGQAYKAVYLADKVLIGKNPGMLSLQKDIVSPQLQGFRYVRAIVPLKKHPNQIIVSQPDGLVHVDAAFKERPKQISGITSNTKILIGDDDDRLWIIDEQTGELIKMTLSSNLDSVVQTAVYGAAQGLPTAGLQQLLNYNGHILAFTKDQVWHYESSSDAFVPDPFMAALLISLNDPLTNVFKDNKDNIWLLGFNQFGYLASGAKEAGAFHYRPFKRLHFDVPLSATTLDDGTMLIGMQQGIVHFDPAQSGNETCVFQSLIRGMTAQDMRDQCYFEGGILNSDGMRIGNGAELSGPIIVPYEHNSLRFELASNFFEASEKMEFSLKLEGYDRDWSSWSLDPFKEYTRIREGDYRLRVVARNIYGTVGQEAILAFRVLPPWYRTFWAFLLWGMLTCSGIFFILRWRLSKLVREKWDLEQKIARRTVTIAEQKEKIEIQNTLLQQERDNLAALSEQIKQMSEFKSRFFANLSHELRTPLTLIITPLERMESEALESPLKQSYRLILKNAQRLLQTINELLNIARNDQNALVLHLQYTPLCEFVRQVLAMYASTSDEKGIKILFNPSISESTAAWIDQSIIGKVVDNLVFNALKFANPTQGLIDVSIHAKESVFLLCVRDNGPGIKVGDEDRIFDRFYRSSSTASLDQKGSGIGLSFAREILAAHQGSIRLINRPGQGAEFVVEFPKEKDGYVNALFADPYPENSNSKHSLVTEPLGIATSEYLPKVLIVDDNADIRQLLQQGLEGKFNLSFAENGQDALKLAIEQMPDLILADVMMPKMNGLQMTQALKSDHHTSHLPVVLLTARSSTESRIEGLLTSADDYISKPFSLVEVEVRINNLIASRQKLKEKYAQIWISPKSVENIESPDQLFLQKISAVVEANMDNPDLDSELLCKELLMSRSSLFRKIKALTNQSATEFVRTFRLRRAAWLLVNSERSVTDIAYDTGFSQVSYFSTCFHEQFKASPSDFRLRNKENF